MYDRLIFFLKKTSPKNSNLSKVSVHPAHLIIRVYTLPTFFFLYPRRRIVGEERGVRGAGFTEGSR